MFNHMGIDVFSFMLSLKSFFMLEKGRKKTKRKAREGLEPSTSCLLDRRNNPYATKP